VATIILTGFPDFDTALQALRSQVDDYLTKPADVKKLLSVLNENLRKPKRHTPVQVKNAFRLCCAKKRKPNCRKLVHRGHTG